MKLLISALILMTSQAWAIKYHQSAAGAIKEIDAAAFDQCTQVFYRNTAKTELSLAHQKRLVKASLKGELINDIGAVGSKLKSVDGSCTYSDNSEALK